MRSFSGTVGERGLGNLFRGAGRSAAPLIRDGLRFDGRARIVDVLWYWLISSLIVLAVSWPTDLLPWDAAWAAKQGIRLVLAVPFVALFIRRLHDQGISGWWALFLLPLPLVNLHQSYRATFAVLNPQWLTEPGPLDGIEIWLLPIVLAMLVLLFRPGMSGPNRHGPDPRARMSHAAPERA